MIGEQLAKHGTALRGGARLRIRGYAGVEVGSANTTYPPQTGAVHAETDDPPRAGMQFDEPLQLDEAAPQKIHIGLDLFQGFAARTADKQMLFGSGERLSGGAPEYIQFKRVPG